MAPHSAAELMELWDALSHRARASQAGLLAEAVTGRDMSAASLGTCQAAILEAHAETFGRRVDCVETCPECEIRVVIDLAIDELLAVQRAAPASGGVLDCEGWRIEYRLPSVADMARMAAASDEETAELRLLEGVVTALHHDGAPVRPSALPPRIGASIAARIEAEDPLAAAEIALRCPDCAHSWESGLDAATLFITRLRAWAQRTLWEVHQLAMRYGWSEAALLAMSPARREAYLMLDAP